MVQVLLGIATAITAVPTRRRPGLAHEFPANAKPQLIFVNADRAAGPNEAADLVIKSMERSILSKKVTYDFARLMEGATEVKCSEFGDQIIAKMD